ncbi:hypothetical protein J4421_05335 [Candidatus Woesearchaeota archaeon]|nr:hypothetical protein [Candidatus Woesearchaeota archaeon]
MVKKKRRRKRVPFLKKKKEKSNSTYVSFEALLRTLKRSHSKQRVLKIRSLGKKKSWDDKMEDKEGYILLKELVKHLKKMKNKKRK